MGITWLHASSGAKHSHQCGSTKYPLPHSTGSRTGCEAMRVGSIPRAAPPRSHRIPRPCASLNVAARSRRLSSFSTRAGSTLDMRDLHIRHAPRMSSVRAAQPVRALIVRRLPPLLEGCQVRRSAKSAGSLPAGVGDFGSPCPAAPPPLAPWRARGDAAATSAGAPRRAEHVNDAGRRNGMELRTWLGVQLERNLDRNSK
eukprot:gene17576-biopygen849